MEFPWVRPVNLFATMTFMNLVAVNDLCILSILTPFYASATLSHCPLAAYSNTPRTFFDQIASGERNKFAKNAYLKYHVLLDWLNFRTYLVLTLNCKDVTMVHKLSP